MIYTVLRGLWYKRTGAQCQCTYMHRTIFSIMASAVSNCRTAAKGCCGALEMVMAGSPPPPAPPRTNQGGGTHFPLSFLQLLLRRGLLDIRFSHHLVSFLKRQHLKGWRPSVSAFICKAHFSRHLWLKQSHPAEVYPGSVPCPPWEERTSGGGPGTLHSAPIGHCGSQAGSNQPKLPCQDYRPSH